MIPNCLSGISIVKRTDKKAKPTFTKVTDPVTIDRAAMLIDIGHKELAKMPNYRASNALLGDPLDDGFRLDIAQLFEREFLEIW